MRETYMCCIDCLVALSSFRPELDLFWHQLVSGISPDRPYVYVQSNFEHQREEIENDLQSLEEGGYIVSMEIGDAGWIVRGYGFREGSQLICVHRHLT